MFCGVSRGGEKDLAMGPLAIRFHSFRRSGANALQVPGNPRSLVIRWKQNLRRFGPKHPQHRRLRMESSDYLKIERGKKLTTKLAYFKDLLCLDEIDISRVFDTTKLVLQQYFKSVCLPRNSHGIVVLPHELISMTLKSRPLLHTSLGKKGKWGILR